MIRIAGDLSCVKFIMEEKDADSDRVPEGRITPKMTPVHMCALYNNTDLVKCVISPSNVNIQDQVRLKTYFFLICEYCFKIYLYCSGVSVHCIMQLYTDVRKSYTSCFVTVLMLH